MRNLSDGSLVGRFAVAAMLAFSVTSEAAASGLLTGAVGAADTATSGAQIAEPLSPSGAQFANPAGLVAFDSSVVVGTGFAYGSGLVSAEIEGGYDSGNEVVAAIPDFAVVVARGRLRTAIGIHGTVGTRFDYDAKPEVGIPEDFLSELSIAALPLSVAYEVNERLWVGAQVMALFGYWRSHFLSRGPNEADIDAFELKHKLTGPGLQVAAGLRWRPHERVAVGLSGRPPGRLWLEGSTVVPTLARQNVHVDVEVPAQMAGSLSFDVRENLWFAYSLRWTDSSSFSDSLVHYDDTPSLDRPFLLDSKDEWRHALGAEWRGGKAWALRGGVSHAGYIVGNRGISPLSYDAEDTRISAGAAFDVRGWRLDGALGWKLPTERRVAAENALVLPGRYESGSAVIVLFSATVALDRESRRR